MSDFVAIDVETANPDLASICQVGIAVYRNWDLVESWESLVNPEDYFDDANVAIHGIDEDAVRSAPRLPEVAARIDALLSGQISVCHTHFDRVAIRQAFEKHSLALPYCVWLDSARVVRRTWDQFAWRGYGLGNVCSFLGHHYNAHDALEDAKAAAVVLRAAVAESGVDVRAWVDRCEWPIDAARAGAVTTIERAGNPAGPLYGEVIVFTGALSLSRAAAADMAAQLGCEVDERVTKKTTILVVGNQDLRRLAGLTVSSKHRRALELRAQGQLIRILREGDFLQLSSLAPESPAAKREGTPSVH